MAPKTGPFPAFETEDSIDNDLGLNLPTWQPSFDSQQTKTYIKQYEENPRQFQPAMLRVINRHAKHHRVPFAYNAEDNKANLESIAKNLGGGFIEGLTTLGDLGAPKPRNEWDAIARNLGHLGGFLGYVPTFGRTGTIAKVIQKLRTNSAPFLAAKFVNKKIGKVVSKGLANRNNSVTEGIKFLQQPVVKDIIEGGFTLGVATGVSSWRQGVDQMMSGFIGGAGTGSVFRLLGNYAKFGKWLGFGPGKRGEIADKVGRGLASSLYDGLHATHQGATTPEQIYSYLLGFYFGVNEMPYHRRLGGQFLQKTRKLKHRNKDLEEVPGWEKLDERTRTYVIQKDSEIPRNTNIPYAFIKELREEGLVKDIPKQKDIEKARRAAIQYERELTTGETEVSIKDIIETDPQMIQRREGTKDFNQDNLDFELSDTIKQRVKNYVDTELQTYTETLPLQDRLKTYLDIQKKWDSLADKAVIDKINPEPEIRKFITDKYNVDTSGQNHYNFWRSWGNRITTQEPVDTMVLELISTPSQFEEIKFNSRPVNTLIKPTREFTDKQGNETVLLEERKLIDSIYENAFKNINPDVNYPISPNTGKPIRAFQVIDTVNIVDKTSKDGERTERIIDLSDLQKNIERKGIDYSKFWNETLAKMYRRMDEQDMYYFGGKGDAHRQYWLRYHPAMKQIPFSDMKKTVRETISEISKKEKVKNYLEKDLDEWVKLNKPLLNRTQSEELYYKATYSNFLYGLEFNGLSYSPANLKRLFKSKDNIVVKNAKDFNKRQQIWFTSGYSANSDFIAPRLAGAEDGTFKYTLTVGPETKFPNQDKLTNKDKNSSYNESEDGGIDSRFDVIKLLNLDYGIPSEGGFNKSFIVSPNSIYGALLGKYGMHTVTKPEEAWMKKNNIHFNVNLLSAKASGTRPYQLREWKNGKFEYYDIKTNKQGKIISKVKSAPRIYEMPIGDIKTVTSEIVSEKTKTKKLRVIKQAFTNLTPYAFKKIKQEDIDDFFEGTTMKRFRGDDLVNARMDKFLEDPDSARGEIDSLIRDLNKLSIDRLLNGLKNNTKAGHEFATKAYQKVLRVNREIKDINLQEGEETRNEREEQVQILDDFESIHERILRVTDTNLSGALHKFVNPMRASAFRNYIVNELTRPVIENSTGVKLRPYTPAMIGRTNKEGSTSKLETDDTIFFLDDGHKTTEVKTAWRKEPYTLSELWDAVRTNKENFPIKEAKEVLRAFVVRVPMDSMSGGAALNFAGFTGAPGLGGLIHGRIARKLGGADLDGDKANIYFGDEVHGFHKNWKDMFAEQAKEFENADGTTINNKIKKDLFAITDKELLNLIESPLLAYSPLRRRFASESAATGRDTLGVAVASRANVLAFHAAVADLPDRKVEIRGKEIPVAKGTYVYEITDENNRRQLVYMKAKIGEKDLNEFRLRARTAIALGSDPMDEGGLKSIDTFREKIAEPLFEYNIKNLTPEEKLKPIFSVSGANSALYGRNIQLGRRFYYNEIISRLNNLLDSDSRGPKQEFSEGITQRNTLIPKIAELIRPLDFSDSVFQRVKLTELNNLYTEFAKDLRDPKYSWLQEVLQRSTLGVPAGPHLNNIFEKKLYTFDGYRAQLNPNHPDFKLDLFKGYEDITDQPSYQRYIEQGGFKSIGDEKARERHLNEYIKFGEDAIVNDLADMTSIRLIKYFADRVGNPERILRIHRDSDNFKNRSARLYKGLTNSILKIQEDLEPMDKATGEKLFKELVKLTEKDAAITKRSQLDSLIKTYKQTLKNKDERDLFDHFMLGTLQKGQQNRIDALIKKQTKGKKISESLKAKIREVEKESAGTSLVRLGFSSPSISESNIKLYFNNYSKLFETAVAFPKDEIKRVQNETDVAAERQKLVDNEGNVLEGNPLDTNELDRKTKKYIDEIAPFTGLTEGKLSKEETRVKTELIDNIKHYFGGNPLPGSQLNGLARALVNRDLNNMTFQDFEVFNNYLKDFREGSYFAKLFQAAKYFPDYRTDPSKPLKGFPELGRRFYLLFPEAVNRELMMHEIMLVNKRGIWKDKRGNVVRGVVQAPTQIINEIRDIHHYAQQTTTASFDEQTRTSDDELSPFFALEDGPAFHRVAGAMMERFGEVRMSNNLNKEPVGNYLTSIRANKKSNEKKAIDITYATEFRKAIKASDWFNIRDKSYVVNLPTGVKKMKGSEITQEIINIISKKNDRYKQFLKGKEGVADKYLKPILEAKTDQQKLRELDNLRDNFLSDVQDSIRKGDPISMDLGMDNLRVITKYLQLRQIKNVFKGKPIYDKKTSEILGTDKFMIELNKVPSDIGKTGEIQSNYYFPHMMYDRKVAAEGLKRQIEAILKDIDSKNGDARISSQKEIKKIIIRHKQLAGDWITSNELNDRYGDVSQILNEIGKEKSKRLDEGFKSYLKNRKIGNMFSRNSHIGGWSYEPAAYDMYAKNITGAFYKQIADITAHEAIYDFRQQKKRQLGDELTNNWANYLELQSRGMSGETINIPEHMLNNPGMKLKGTPYTWFADNLWAKRVNKLRDMLGLRGKKVTELDEIIKKVDNPIKKVISGGQTGVDTLFLQTAQSNNITTGGTAPPKYLRDDVSTPERRKKFLKEFGLVEGEPDPSIYTKRTMKNVDDADGTIAFMPRLSTGTSKTIGYAQTRRWIARTTSKDDGKKPILVIKDLQNKEQVVNDIQDFVEKNNLKVINGAGPRERNLKQEEITKIKSILNDVFKPQIDKTESKTNIKEITDAIPELQDWDANTLRKYGQMEAKYQLATLLAHPKSAIANLYGGSVLTLQSTGFEYFKNARDINYLRSKVNKKWQGMDDVYNWVKSHGVVEDFLLYELQINPDVQSKAMQKTIQESIAKIKKDPDFADTSLYEIARKNGLTEKVFNKAAFFMRKPERTLRRDAFVAHYLKARDKFDGLITDYNDPFLIDMAKKGVKGTQFLYSAPFRPMWARSAMGKVFSRFQIWAYNSVRFRNDAIREAKIYGFEGEAGEKLQRILVGDMFMLGLANMFPYSIFESALPAPWNYLQDSADLMFGDEKQRDRAFFGTYPAPLQPLQAITPPALRLFPPLFKAMIHDDYTRMADYYLWTTFPFGRIARDTIGPGGLLENPAQAVEKFTGFPYMKLASSYVKSKKELEVPKTSLSKPIQKMFDKIDDKS